MTPSTWPMNIMTDGGKKLAWKRTRWFRSTMAVLSDDFALCIFRYTSMEYILVSTDL
jgi:hypothetical protein